jgi:hypothetical protein
MADLCIWALKLVNKPLFVKQRRASTATLPVAAANQSFGRLEIAKQTGSFDTSFFSDVRFVAALSENVAFHQSKAVKKYATELGVELIVVRARSPWFVPIQGVFSYIKHQFYAPRSADESYVSLASIHARLH